MNGIALALHVLKIHGLLARDENDERIFLETLPEGLKDQVKDVKVKQELHSVSTGICRAYNKLFKEQLF